MSLNLRGREFVNTDAQPEVAVRTLSAPTCSVVGVPNEANDVVAIVRAVRFVALQAAINQEQRALPETIAVPLSLSNLIPYSEQVDQWNLGLSGLRRLTVVNTDIAADPFGGNATDEITHTLESPPSDIVLEAQQNITVNPNTDYNISVHSKLPPIPDNATHLHLRVTASGVQPRVAYDMRDGGMTLVEGTPTNLAISLEGGFYRCSFAFNSGSNTIFTIRMYATDGAGAADERVPSDVLHTLHWVGMQFTEGLTLKPYKATAGTPTSFDPTVVGFTSSNNTDITVSTATVSVTGNNAILSAGPVSVDHPMSQNVNGGFISNAVERVFDNTHVLYLHQRVTQFNAVQPKGMWDGSRVSWSNDWTSMHADNPYGLYVLHDSPLRLTALYQTNSANALQWRYEYTVNNRRTALLYRSQNDDDEVPFIEAGSSLTANNQTAHHFKTTDPGLQDHWSGIVNDLLTGANLMSRNMGGVDVSDFMGYFNDGSPAVNPKFNRTTTAVVTNGKGTVINANVDGSGWLGLGRNIVELSTRFNPETFGSHPDDPSFGNLTSPKYIGFLPNNNNSPGYAAFVVTGYKNVGSSNCQVYVRDLPSAANATQLYAVKNGDRYNVNNSTGGTDNPDQDGNGTSDDNRDAGNKIWTAGYVAMYDQADVKVLAQTGHDAGRGHNAGGTIDLKRIGGLPHPHGGFRTMDYMNAENGDSAGDFQPNNNSLTQEYTTINNGMERIMRGMYMMESYIRPNPGGWNEGKPRGVLYDISVWDGLNTFDWDYTNDPANPGLMASYLRFYRALMFTVPNTGMGYTIQIGYPCLIEEAFLDIDKGFVQPAPLGTYDPTGGGNGTAGSNRPVGSWTWATGGVGDFTSGSKRIYGRRVGDRHYMFINIADPPGGGRVYKPSHLAGGDTPRATEDHILPADFASIYAPGHLVAGETLKKIDPSTYINETMTEAYKSHPLTAAEWANNKFQYGPRQEHPNDANNEGGTYTLSNTRLIARDNAFNDGADVDQSVPFPLGTQEAAIFEIVGQPGGVWPANGAQTQVSYALSDQTKNFETEPFRTWNSRKDLIIQQWLYPTQSQVLRETDQVNWIKGQNPNCKIMKYTIKEYIVDQPAQSGQALYLGYEVLVDNGTEDDWVHYDSATNTKLSVDDPQALWGAINAAYNAGMPTGSLHNNYAVGWWSKWKFKYSDQNIFDAYYSDSTDIRDAKPDYVLSSDGVTPGNPNYTWFDVGNTNPSLYRQGVVYEVGQMRAVWGDPDLPAISNGGRDGSAVTGHVIKINNEWADFWDGRISENMHTKLELEKKSGVNELEFVTNSPDARMNVLLQAMFVTETMVDRTASNKLGKGIVLADWPIGWSGSDPTSVSDIPQDYYEVARFNAGLCALHESFVMGTCLTRGDLTFPYMDEYVYDSGDPVGAAPFLGTVDDTDINYPLTVRAPDQSAVSGQYGTYWQEYDNVLWVVNLNEPTGLADWPQATEDTITLPSADLGNGEVWRFADANYVNPARATGGTAAENQSPAVNTGALTGPTIDMKRWTARMLVRSSS